MSDPDEEPIDPFDEDDPLATLSVFVAGQGPQPGSVAFMIEDTMFVTDWHDSIRLVTLLLVQATLAAAKDRVSPEKVHEVFTESLQETWKDLQESINNGTTWPL